MKTIALDVHTVQSQMDVVSEDGEVLLERQVETDPEELRRAVVAIPGPKRVVFEEGPLSGLIRDALASVADEVISCIALEPGPCHLRGPNPEVAAR